MIDPGLLMQATTSLNNQLNATGSQPLENSSSNHLKEECFKIATVLRAYQGSPLRDEAILVYPFILNIVSKKKRGQTDFIVRVSNARLCADCEVYYRPEHNTALYKNIVTAYARCNDVLDTVVKFIHNDEPLVVRVSTGCFNYRSVPYTVSKKRFQGMPLVEIELHSRFQSDQEDQILPLLNRVRGCI